MGYEKALVFEKIIGIKNCGLMKNMKVIIHLDNDRKTSG